MTDVALPTVERMQAVEVRPDDVVVVKLGDVDGDPAVLEAIGDLVQDVFPDNRVLVLHGDVELEVRRPVAET